MVVFKYRIVGGKFYNEIKDLIISGESVVFIGAHYSGKHIVLDNISEMLAEEKISPVVQLRSPGQFGLTSESDLGNWISSGISDLEITGIPRECKHEVELRETEFLRDCHDNVFDPIDRLYKQNSQPVVLLAANVDDMPHQLARRFLEGVRARAERRELIAVLSGEYDFGELVYGPKSEFNCAYQYFLQGLERNEFRRVANDALKHLNLEREPDTAVMDRFYSVCGGQLFLLRILIWTIAENRVLNNVEAGAPIKVEEIPDSIDLLKNPFAYGAPIVQYAYEIISLEPRQWPYLEALLESDMTRIDIREYGPTTLEIAGIAIRETDCLVFASALVRDYYRKYFCNRRLGDMYAAVGEWDGAFSYYDKIVPEERLRPVGVEDRKAVNETVNAFCRALHVKATENPQVLTKFFTKGCQLILGIRDVTFWSYEKKWRLIYFINEIGDEEYYEIQRCLERNKTGKEINLSFSGNWSKYINGIILPGSEQDQQYALIIGDFSKKAGLSLIREKLAKLLLEHFRRSYVSAISIENSRTRLAVRDRHIEIINEILMKILDDVMDLETSLKIAAAGLRRLGYRRVIICLVDPKREKLEPVVYDADECNANSDDSIKNTNWAIGLDEKSVHSYVIKTKRTIIIKNSGKKRLADRENENIAGIKHFAVLPILDHHGNTIGTIHVEREDDGIPTQTEVSDLEIFAKQLAIAIIKSEQVVLLQSVLDKSEDLVAVVDAGKRIRYVNEKAAKIFGSEAGWIRNPNEKNLKNMRIKEVWPILNKAVEKRERTVRHIHNMGIDNNMTGKVLVDCIRDWRNQTVGALLHVTDLSFLYKISGAFQYVASATNSDSAMSAVLEVIKMLGFEWGRMYVLDENDPNCLVSKMSFGFDDPGLETEFGKGGLKLPRENNWASWIGFKRRTPIVLSYLNDHLEGWEWKTRHGLNVINIQNPYSAKFLQKKPGELWIEFPVTADNKPLAKISFQCGENLPPENYELLKMLCDMYAGLLPAFLSREQANREKEQWIYQAAEKSVAVTAHNIATRLSSLPLLLQMYREEERNRNGIIELNKQFNRILRNINMSVLRTKEMLATVEPKCASFNIVNFIKNFFNSALENEDWFLKEPPKPVELHADSHLLHTAMAEIIENAKLAADNQTPLFVKTIIADFQNKGREWIRIAVADNGKGVPESYKQRIFDDFYTHRPGKKQGLGLGLGHVRRVIRAHGGDIREEGIYGEGAKFVIELPVNPNG